MAICTEEFSDHSSDEELNLLSPKFDPLKALYKENVSLPFPNIAPFNNLSEYERAMKKPKPQPAKTDPKSQILAPIKAPIPKTSNLQPCSSLVTRKRKPLDNVVLRMERCVRGPLSLLKRCRDEKLLVRVWTRNAVAVRGISSGYIVAFDKHFNLAMVDVDEIHKKPVFSPNRDVKEKTGKKESKFEDDSCSKCDIEISEVSVFKGGGDLKKETSTQVEHNIDKKLQNSDEDSQCESVSDQIDSSQQIQTDHWKDTATKSKSKEEEKKHKYGKEKKRVIVKDEKETKKAIEDETRKFKERRKTEEVGQEKCKEQYKDSDISKQMSGLGIAEKSDISRVKRDQLDVGNKRLSNDSALYFKRDRETQSSVITSRHVNQLLIRGDNVILVSIAQEVK